MKKIVTLIMVTIVSVIPVVAQNYMVVDSKKIFDSLEEYTQALTQIDNLGKKYQADVDAKFDEVERLYNSYMQRQNALNTTERAVFEAKITKMEKEAVEYQESIFSQDGLLMKQRLEIISPIQKRVFATIETYAKSHKFDLVLDEASNPTVMYKAASVDHTAGVIEALKK